MKIRKNQKKIPDKTLKELLDKKPKGLDLIAEGIEDFPCELLELSDLEYLSIGPSALTELPQELFLLPKLKILKFKNGKISKINTPDSPSLSPLENVQLTNNSLEEIPEYFQNFMNLQTLDLAGNNLTKLPEGLGNLTALNWINLDRNAFERLPNCIKKLKNLSHLSLDGNKFLPEEKDEIYKKFGIWF